MAITFGVLCMIFFTVLANLLMKVGASHSPTPVLVGFLSWTTAMGLASFGIAGLVYAWVLKTLPLNVAQSFTAASFIAVIAASRLFLTEPISATRWIGIGLIASGIAIVALTERGGLS